MGMHSEKNNVIVSFDVRIVTLSSRCLWKSMSLLKSVIRYECPPFPPIPVWNFPSGTGLSFQGTLYDNDLRRIHCRWIRHPAIRRNAYTTLLAEFERPLQTVGLGVPVGEWCQAEAGFDQF